MKTETDLIRNLRRIDGKGYKSYKGLAGEYRFDGFTLVVDHVQGDPYAAPSRILIRIDRKASGFAPDTTKNRVRSVALRDYLTRMFFAACGKFAKGGRGSGKSGLITIDRPVQEVLDRSSMRVDDHLLEARIFMGLPANGRRVAGRDAAAMFGEEVPKIVNAALFMKHLDKEALYRHLFVCEDAAFLRESLGEKGLVAFVGDDSLLPRASGIDPSPMERGKAALFSSPESFRVAVDLPNAGRVTGMGIPEGVTLVVGGGYHGKSTLLNALERGIYNHLPGDGREFAVTVPSAVKIRAADGRNIEKIDISPFINNLPLGRDTASFSTSNASGSTSQAANILEAVEVGAGLLLLDEDTSATNFMIRDLRMQKLVAKEDEPITPFIDKVRQLYRERGISTILVMGGSGDYFGVADHVIQMCDYLPVDVTKAAREIAESFSARRIKEGGKRFGALVPRIPQAKSVNPEGRGGKVKISAPRPRELLFGRETVDMGDLEQIVDISQTRAVGHGIRFAKKYMDKGFTLANVMDKVMAEIEKRGLDILTPHVTGDLAEFRRIELAGALNRMRCLKVKQKRA